MRVLSAAELLRVWERGWRQTSATRALLVLEAACDLTPDQLARLSIGRRDAALLTLRELMFGTQIECVVKCPRCREFLELIFEAAYLRAAEALPSQGVGESYRLKHGGYEISFRPPNSLDLNAITACPNAELAHELLVERCTH